MNNKKRLEILLDDPKDEDYGNISDDNFVIMTWGDMLMNAARERIPSSYYLRGAVVLLEISFDWKFHLDFSLIPEKMVVTFSRIGSMNYVGKNI